jgi:ppGpp synthetase/RelA/SpoT-type nucleotidyltranferase
MHLSRSKIDKAGERLVRETWNTDDQYLESELIFDEYRKLHIEPLTEITIKLQSWLIDFNEKFYIAQRIKRKPQILRKLKRFSIRLSQLQDLGGVRIIFEKNIYIDKFIVFLKNKLSRGHYFSIEKMTDYREKGRDDSGYRAVHLILLRKEMKIELQLRSRIQHNWAERIERTSIIYGYYLKELEGDQQILDYFRLLSNIFYEIECDRKPSKNSLEDLEDKRLSCEKIITISDKKNILNSFVNEDYIKAMISRDASQKTKFHNWMIVFDWKTGQFLHWQLVIEKSDNAIKTYVEFEKKWSEEKGYEVVMIGSSDPSTIRKTHSHYFGLETYANILQSIDSDLYNFNKREEMDNEARILLQTLYLKGYWNTKKVSLDTLKNHYCNQVNNINKAINVLENMGFVIKTMKDSYSLNIKKRKDIEKYI